MNEKTLLILILIEILSVNIAAWFIAGILNTRNIYKKGQKTLTRFEPLTWEMKPPEVLLWKDAKKHKIPLNIKVDVKLGNGIIHKGVELITRNPIKYKPDFMKYKNITEWRYSD